MTKDEKIEFILKKFKEKVMNGENVNNFIDKVFADKPDLKKEVNRLLDSHDN